MAEVAEADKWQDPVKGKQYLFVEIFYLKEWHKAN
jgi:hypothetical protein